MAALIPEAKEQLKSWLVKTLEPVSDADPDVLSKYVLALVQADPLREDMGDICVSKLEEFLGEETNGFVSKLTDTLKDGSYRAAAGKTPNREGNPNRDERPAKRSRQNESENRRDRRDGRNQRDRRDSREGRHQPRDRDRGGRHNGPPPNWGPPQHDPRWGPPRPEWNGAPPMMMGGYRPPGKPQRGGWGAKVELPQDSKFTLLVKNVDPQYLNMMKLIGHFSKFGELLNVQMRPKEKGAVVQFAKEEDATRAFQSPLSVCNNRFIKVLRATFDLDENVAKDDKLFQDGKENEATAEEKKAAAAAHGKEVLEQKRGLIDQQKTLMVQKEALLLNQVSQCQELSQRMKMAGASETEQQGLEVQLTKLTAELRVVQTSLGTAAPTEADEKLASLKSELSELQSQAESMTSSNMNVLPHRGSGRGAGRFGGRRGGRGGRGGGRGSGGGSNTLDNRTTVLKVSSLPDAAQDQSVLKQHFESFGLVAELAMDSTDKSCALIKFADRYGAQAAKQHGNFYGETELKLDWLELANVPEGAWKA